MVFGQSWPHAAHAQLVADPVGAFGSPWRTSAGLGVQETWSDNINLQPEGQRRSDFVTEIDPTFSLSRNGRRLQLTLNYTPQYLYYANRTNGTQLRNLLSSNLHAAMIDNFLSFDGAASITQQNISPFGTQAANTVNGSNNRVESRNISFGPTLRSRLDQDLTYSLGYNYQLSTTDSDAIATSHTSTLFGNVQTSTSFRDVGIGANVNRTEQNYGGFNDIITEQVGSTLTYVLQPTIHLSASVGYDRDRYPATGQPDLKGLSYSAGFDWEPSRHTSLNAQFGHRYFGPTANVRLTEATPHLSVSGIYTRDQTTSGGAGATVVANPYYQLLNQALLINVPDPVLRAQAVQQALTQSGLSNSEFGTSQFFSNQLYVQKRAELSVALLGRVNTVTFDVSRVESQALSNLTVGFDIFNQASRFRTDQYAVNWSHQLGHQTSVSASIQKTRSSALEGSGTTNGRTIYASVNKQLTRKLNGSVFVRNVKQTGTGDNGGFYSGNYHENAVVGTLHVTFY